MSSDESDDDFVTFGTALEPLDEDAMPRKKAFTLEDQVVRDSKGRRRFHGAFTGGFSAGFMNTVGSLEGWKPSEFKSSRAERGGIREQKPQDFMDDEDIGEFGIAPSRLTARSDYNDSGPGRKRVAPSFHEGIIPGTPVLHQLLQNVRETVGVRLLKAMGWKLGQGVGPRVDVHTRREEERKIYGCEPPPGFSAVDSDEEDLENLTFAPRDVEAYVVHPKKDTFGLGYSGLDRHSVLGTQSTSSGLKMSDKNRKVNIKGQAFGVGAFEEEDEDIYSREDMSQYDFVMGEEKNEKSLAQLTAPGVVPGFVLAKTKVVKKSFPLPSIPPGFRGKHQPRKSKFSPATSSQSVPAIPAGLGRHDITAQTRSVMINDSSERSLPPAPATEETSQTSNDLKTTLADANNDSLIQQPTKNLQPLLSGRFKPFVHDPDKQRRYEQYLTLSDKTQLSSLQPLSLSTWEREREKKEFEQAAAIFKPLAGVMEDRFTSAQQPDDFRDPLAVVEKVKHGDETQRNAARMKMFGTFTRKESDWGPCSLLCKRFNVPEPGTTNISVVDSKPRKKYSIFDSLDSLVKKEKTDTPSSISQEMVAAEVKVEPESAKIIPTELEPASEPPFIDPTTKVDLFKAIFLDSSDEEEDNNSQVSFEEPVKNIVRNSSPPRGIFANIDLEALTARRNNSTKPPVSVGTPPNIPSQVPNPVTPTTPLSSATPLISATSPISNDVPYLIPTPSQKLLSESDEGIYGPKLPDRILVTTQSAASSSSSENEWKVKSKKGLKHKKNKKSKKRKDKKHKKKHKKSIH